MGPVTLPVTVHTYGTLCFLYVPTVGYLPTNLLLKLFLPYLQAPERVGSRADRAASAGLQAGHLLHGHLRVTPRHRLCQEHRLRCRIRSRRPYPPYK